MSFSFDTKKELCEILTDNLSEISAQCYGSLLFAKSFTYKKIVFTTENKYISERVTEDLTQIFAPVIERTSGLRTRNSQNHLITLKIINQRDCDKIFTSYGHSKNDISLRINRANLSEPNDIQAFLRGVFLSCGSVTNPQKNYHLEFKVPHRNLANDLLTLLCEIEQCALSPKSVVRQGYFIVYFKDSEQIADFLTYIGAFNSSMEIINTKITKQVKNNAVRKFNSEMHNINKTADASARQITAIKKLMKSDVYKTLPFELQEIAQLRLDNPELSLRALGELTSDKISRSGVNHRFKKLMSYVDELE